jgi:hypothetical protein
MSGRRQKNRLEQEVLAFPAESSRATGWPD